MKRKFSFDIPKLKIGSLRPEASSKQQQDGLHGHLLISPTESQPPTPKSVRPPLPGDIDAELRAACTYIITHPKPSHERWDRLATRPALDYASIKADVDLAPMFPARTRSLRHRADPSHDASKYSYKPHAATEDLFKHEQLAKSLPQTSARSRADQLMAGGSAAVASVHTRHERSGSHNLPSAPPHQPAAYASRTEPLEKPKASGRSDSVRTSGSTPHTDSTDYPWSASTALTSAAITPARSKRTSSQAINYGSESGSAPRIEDINAEWMRSELEKHRKLIEEKERARDRDNGFATSLADDTPTQTIRTFPTAHISARVPARKPVPSRPGSRQAGDVSRAGTRQENCQDSKDDPHPAYRGRTDSIRPEVCQQAPEIENRGRMRARSGSRFGRAARSASRAAIQAANRAESITHEIIGHYFRPSSEQSAQELVERPPSRTRDFTANVKDYFRPGSATGNRSRKPSVDWLKGHRRSQSSGSQLSGVAPSEHSSRWRGRLFDRRRSNVALPDPTVVPLPIDAQQEPPQPQKPAIDLNRELPPLPGLDQWKADDESNAPPVQTPVERSKTPTSDKSIFRIPTGQGFRRALSRKGIRRAASPHPVDLPTPPHSQKQSVDGKSWAPNYHPLPSPPALSASSGLSSPLAYEFGLSSLSLSQSVEPVPSSPSIRSTHARPADYLRPYTRSQQSTPENLSRNTPHKVDHPRKAGPPVSGSSRAWSRVRTNASTPLGHSRESSDKASAARKYSIDEYNRQYQNAADIRSTDSKEKRRHWWKGGKDKRQAEQSNWMDQVVKSGARNGMLVAGDAAGTPVVRY